MGVLLAIEARHTERESDMLQLFIKALRKHGPPDVLYLDNGSTYSGEVLRTACARLGTALVDARPYDAPARGKMERFNAEPVIMRCSAWWPRRSGFAARATRQGRAMHLSITIQAPRWPILRPETARDGR